MKNPTNAIEAIKGIEAAIAIFFRFSFFKPFSTALPAVAPSGAPTPVASNPA